jgi:hypothetical protein
LCATCHPGTRQGLTETFDLGWFFGDPQVDLRVSADTSRMFPLPIALPNRQLLLAILCSVTMSAAPWAALLLIGG